MFLHVKNILFLCILLGWCSLFLPACSAKKPTAELSLKDYFPSQPGSLWEYKGKGNEYASFTRESTLVQDNLVHFCIDNSGTKSAEVYSLENNMIVRVFSSPEEYIKEELTANNFTPNDNTVILKTPLKVGNTWEVPDGYREITDIDASIKSTVASGQEWNDCIKVKVTFNESDSVVYEYYKKDTGMVRYVFQAGDYTVTSDLVSYKSQ